MYVMPIVIFQTLGPHWRRSSRFKTTYGPELNRYTMTEKPKRIANLAALCGLHLSMMVNFQVCNLLISWLTSLTAMHLETLLYMLVQSEETLPPPGVVPDFALLSKKAREEAVPNNWVQIPAQAFAVGLDDPETDSGPNRYFGWDNEKPARQVSVPSFKAKSRPITNEDYARYLEQNDEQDLPSMWTTTQREIDTDPSKKEGSASAQRNGLYLNGDSTPLKDSYLEDKFVKSVYGPIPLRYALDWPMIASNDELSCCAQWLGGRIPTADEVRSIYHYVDVLKTEEAEGVQTRTISAVNGYMDLSIFCQNEINSFLCASTS